MRLAKYLIDWPIKIKPDISLMDDKLVFEEVARVSEASHISCGMLKIAKSPMASKSLPKRLARADEASKVVNDGPASHISYG